MLNTLRKLNERPPRFGKSSAKFWNDPYISGKMLEAHLNPDLESATRKHDFVRQSVEWLTVLMPPERYKRVLDLGCGPGIYAEMMTIKGYQVTGLDLSENSVQYARISAAEQELDIEYHVDDYIQAPLEGEYDLITLIYCDFGVLSDEDRSILLKKVYKLLAPGGCFLLDAFTPEEYAGREEYHRWEFAESGFWRPQPHLLLKSLYRYEEEHTFLNQYIVINREDTVCYNLWEQTFTAFEMEKALTVAGFGEIRLYGNVAGEPYDQNSKTLCAAAKRPTLDFLPD